MGTIFLILNFCCITLCFFALWHPKDICNYFFKPEPDKPKKEIWRKVAVGLLAGIAFIVFVLSILYFWKTYNFELRIIMVILIILLLITNITTSKHTIAHYIMFLVIAFFISFCLRMTIDDETTKISNLPITQTLYINCNGTNKNNTKVNLATVGENEINMYFIASYNESELKLPTELEQDECTLKFIDENEIEKFVIIKEIHEDYTWIYRNNIPKKNTTTEVIKYNFYIKPSSLKFQ